MFLFLLTAYSFLGCSPERTLVPKTGEIKSNIIVFTVNNLPVDKLEAYGGSDGITQNIDRIASSGVVFAEAHTVSTTRIAANTSFLTGLLPKNHSQRDSGFWLSQDLESFAGVAQNNGYATAGFVSSYELHPLFGYGKGFARYEHCFHQDKFTTSADHHCHSTEFFSLVTEWWQQNASAKMLWVQMGDLEISSTHTLDEKLQLLDQAIGDLLNSLDDDLENTSVIISGDRGVSNSNPFATLSIDRQVTRIPLVIRPSDQWVKWNELTNADVSQRVSQGVSIIDLAPTIADLVGGNLAVDGRSLINLILGQPFNEGVIYAENTFPLFSFGQQPYQMIQRGDIRIEKTSQVKAYLWKDNRQTLPHKKLLTVALDRFGAIPKTGGKPTMELSAEILPQGKSSIKKEFTLGFLQKYGGNVAELQGAFDSDPYLLGVGLYLSEVYKAQGALDKQRGILQELNRVYPFHPFVLYRFALLSFQQKRFTEVIALTKDLLRVNAFDWRAYELLTRAYAATGQYNMVFEWASTGVEMFPKNGVFHYHLGLYYLDANQPIEALASLQSAGKLNYQNDDFSLWLGVAYEQNGNQVEASQAYQKAIQDLDKDPRPAGKYGLFLVSINQCEKALPFLQMAVQYKTQNPMVKEALARCSDP